MATKKRPALRSLFENGAIPTAQHFGDLIDSALNRREDKIMGVWSAGTAYRLGEVVLFQKTLYILSFDGVETLNSATAMAYSKTPPPTTAEPKTEHSYCSQTKPTDDTEHWSQLEFDLHDLDWNIFDEYLEAQHGKNVGIGTQNRKPDGDGSTAPQAQFHVFEKLKGELKFNPSEVAGKGIELLLENWDNPDCKPESFVSMRLDDAAFHQKTNAAHGFSFEMGQKTDDSTSSPLVVFKTDDEGNPQVGIGTSDPKTTLSVSKDSAGDIEINADAPEISITNQHDGEDAAQFSMTVGSEFADFFTTSKNGFRFQQKPTDGPSVSSVSSEKQVGTGYGSEAPTEPEPPAEPLKNHVVVVDENGQVGIGTEQPAARLDVTDQTSGAVQVWLDGLKPALAILNLDEELANQTAFTLGVDNATAMLTTSAGCGFVFKQNKPNSAANDLDSGEKEVWIDQNGHVGIGKSPANFTLDTAGSARQNESYTAILNDGIEQKGDIEKALETVCKFKPIQFSWKNTDAELNTTGLHFGLKDSECEKFLPAGLVKKQDKAVSGVNYVELIPLLMKAMQEQQAQIDALKKRVADLEHGNGYGKPKGNGY